MTDKTSNYKIKNIYIYTMYNIFIVKRYIFSFMQMYLVYCNTIINFLDFSRKLVKYFFYIRHRHYNFINYYKKKKKKEEIVLTYIKH